MNGIQGPIRGVGASGELCAQPTSRFGTTRGCGNTGAVVCADGAHYAGTPKNRDARNKAPTCTRSGTIPFDAARQQEAELMIDGVGGSVIIRRISFVVSCHADA